MVPVWRGRRRLRIWSFRRPGGSGMEQASIFPRKTERQPNAVVAFRSGRRRLRIWSFRRPGGSGMEQASISFVKPKGNPTQWLPFGAEEGGCGYGAFAAPAEAEWSRLLLTQRAVCCAWRLSGDRPRLAKNAPKCPVRGVGDSGARGLEGGALLDVILHKAAVDGI